MLNLYPLTSVLLLSLLSSPVFASVIQSIGSGSAVKVVDGVADFENPNALTDNPYSEGGMLFSRINLTSNNNSCGFAGCQGHPGFGGFSGNYMYGSGYYASVSSGYFSIKSAGSVFAGLEFVIGNGKLVDSGIQNVYWDAYLQGTLVGSGEISQIAAGQVIGFADLLGFDELRYTDSLIPANASPAFDSVKAQFVNAPVPVPATLWLFFSAMSAWFSWGRCKKRI